MNRTVPGGKYHLNICNEYEAIYMNNYIHLSQWMNVFPSPFFYVTMNQTIILMIAVQCDEYNNGYKYWKLRKHRGKNPNQCKGVFRAPSLETDVYSRFRVHTSGANISLGTRKNFSGIKYTLFKVLEKYLNCKKLNGF